MRAEKIEVACRSASGATLDEMVEALIDTYWRAKTERADVTRALYRSVVELDNQALIEAFAARVDTATAAMLASASDASFTNPGEISLTLVTVIFGTVRNVFERNLTTAAVGALHRQLALMCRSYLKVVLAEGYDRSRPAPTADLDPSIQLPLMPNARHWIARR